MIRREDTGEVGDFRFAAVIASGGASGTLVVVSVELCPLFVFLRRVESSLCNLIRMDLLMGRASSVVMELWPFDRASRGRVPPLPRPSASESDVDVDKVSVERLLSDRTCEFDRGTRFSELDITTRSLGSEDPDKPTACAVEELEFRFWGFRRRGISGEKRPSLS